MWDAKDCAKVLYGLIISLFCKFARLCFLPLSLCAASFDNQHFGNLTNLKLLNSNFAKREESIDQCNNFETALVYAKLYNKKKL